MKKFLKEVETSLVKKSRGPNSNTLAYTKCAFVLRVGQHPHANRRC